MKNVLLLLALAIVSLTSFSQNDYRKGYIITQDKDTVRGWINFRVDSRKYRNCEFRQSPDGETKDYGSGELVGYGYENDQVFLSKTIAIDNEPPHLEFLEVIVSGKLTLYRFEESFFTEILGDSIAALKIKTERAIVNHKPGIRETKLYLGILNYQTLDCEEMKSLLPNVVLTERSLTKFVVRYNQCSGGESRLFKEKKPSLIVVPGVSIGIITSKLEMSSTYYTYTYLDATFSKSTELWLSVMMDATWPRINERLSLHLEAGYSAPSYYASNLVDKGGAYEHNYVSFQIQELKVPLGIRYNFPERKITPHLMMGVAPTWHKKTTAGRVTLFEVGGNIYVQNPGVVELRNYQFGYWASLGASRSISRRLACFLDFRFEITDGIIPVPYWNTIDSNIYNILVSTGVKLR